MPNALIALLQLTVLFPIFQSEDSRHSPAAPDGWHFCAFEPADYWHGIDSVTFHGGRRSGSVVYAVDPMVVHPRRRPAHFFTAFKAQAFRNRRVRITAYIKGRGIHGGAFAWCHLEQRNRQNAYPLSKEPIVGTTDWLKQTAVIDVAGSADIIAIGVSLEGKGAVWLDDVQIEAVENSMPTTKEGPGLSERLSLLGVQSIPDGPHNLDFEQ